jgi:hypothetical protein
MKCASHAEVDAAGYCRQCGKALCTTCCRNVRGAFYCEDCLAAEVGGFGTPEVPNPGVALGLGFIPGVGAIYNGEYLKAFIHLLIFGGLISLMDSDAARGLEPLIGFLMLGFYAYMPFDAYQTAKRRARGQAARPTGWDQLGFGEGGKANPIGPILLIVLGALFLLNNFAFFEWTHYLRKFWPAILIALGVWLLSRRSPGATG